MSFLQQVYDLIRSAPKDFIPAVGGSSGALSGIVATIQAWLLFLVQIPRAVRDFIVMVLNTPVE